MITYSICFSLSDLFRWAYYSPSPPCCCKGQNSWLHSALCVCVRSHLLYLFVWLLSCFHTLAVGNNAVVNTGVHVSFKISVFIVFRSGIAGSHGRLFLGLFFNWLHQFTFPWTVYKGSLCSTSLPVFVIWGLWWGLFWQVWCDSSLWFWLLFPDD